MEEMSRKVHPMVSVPDAIRTVLHQTASVLVNKGGSSVKRVSSGKWKELLHETLAHDVLMADPGYPPYNASIMDGYAIRAEEFDTPKPKTTSTDSKQPWTHCVVDKIFAGDDFQAIHTDPLTSQKGESGSTLPHAIYITTGAGVPDCYNCIVPIEQCQVSEDQSQISISKYASVSDGTWIRKVGCDMPAGSVVLPQGHVLDPIALGLLQQVGVHQIEIQAKINVGVLSTGNELLRDNDDDKSKMMQHSGQIPDVNRPILLSLLATFGNCNAFDLGIERDDNVVSLTQTMQKALEQCDVIITTGGVSMGESDIMEQVLTEQLNGTLHFGRMHMKPGKPTTFVTIQNTFVFAMPGNPVSAMVCANLLVKPCLDLLYTGTNKTTAITNGESIEQRIEQIVSDAWIHPEQQATLAQDLKLDKERPEYHRVILKEAEGGTQAISTGVQRSSRLLSLLHSQALLILPQAKEGKTVAKAGDTYTVILLDNAVPAKRVRVANSVHLQRKGLPKECKLAVIHVIPPHINKDVAMNDPSQRVRNAFSSAKSGIGKIVISTTMCLSTCNNTNANALLDLTLAQEQQEIDFFVMVCAPFKGSFTRYLDITTQLREMLEKSADTLAFQARRGAASQDPISGLFEVVVGYLPSGKGSMLVCLPENGLDGGLQHVRELLQHALQVARGK